MCSRIERFRHCPHSRNFRLNIICPVFFFQFPLHIPHCLSGYTIPPFIRHTTCHAKRILYENRGFCRTDMRIPVGIILYDCRFFVFWKIFIKWVIQQKLSALVEHHSGRYNDNFCCGALAKRRMCIKFMLCLNMINACIMLK